MSTDQLPAFRRGDTWRLLITPPADPVLGAILPLDGRDVWFTVKEIGADAADDSDAVIQHKVAYSSLPIVNTPEGDKRLFTVPSNLTNIPPKKYRADVQLVLPGSPPEVDSIVVDSRFEVTTEVTRKVA